MAVLYGRISGVATPTWNEYPDLRQQISALTAANAALREENDRLSALLKKVIDEWADGTQAIAEKMRAAVLEL